MYSEKNTTDPWPETERKKAKKLGGLHCLLSQITVNVVLIVKDYSEEHVIQNKDFLEMFIRITWGAFQNTHAYVGS